jgi:hypothetical protein
MNALFYLDYAKQANEGTTRMRMYMKEANLPEPEFYQREIGFHQVHVVLRNAIEARKQFVDAGAMKLIGEQVFDSLTPDEKQVINFVAEHGRINVSDANRILNRDWHTAKGVLEGLMARQILHRRAKSAKPRSMALYLLRRPEKGDFSGKVWGRNCAPLTARLSPLGGPVAPRTPASTRFALPTFRTRGPLAGVSAARMKKAAEAGGRIGDQIIPDAAGARVEADEIAKRRRQRMIRVAITAAAYHAIARTPPVGSVGYKAEASERGERLIWLDHAVVARLRAIRGSGESYGEVILRLAADGVV